MFKNESMKAKIEKYGGVLAQYKGILSDFQSQINQTKAQYRAEVANWKQKYQGASIPIARKQSTASSEVVNPKPFDSLSGHRKEKSQKSVHAERRERSQKRSVET